MRDLYFIVEGETELEFVNKILIPYFNSQGIFSHIQGLAISMSGGGHGFNNIQHFINTVYPVMRYNGEPIITTLIDYFRLNSETKIPGYLESLALALTDDRIFLLEQKLNESVQNKMNYRFFIPYIQKHEMETLLFSSPENGFYFESDNIKNAILEIYKDYNNIEDINGSEHGAPSKRLEAIYKADGKKYVKVIDGIEIADNTGIDKILEKCPRFKSWIDSILFALNNW
ncbi:DUF4276 family protein [Flavobacterium hauense]